MPRRKCVDSLKFQRHDCGRATRHAEFSPVRRKSPQPIPRESGRSPRRARPGRIVVFSITYTVTAVFRSSGVEGTTHRCNRATAVDTGRARAHAGACLRGRCSRARSRSGRRRTTLALTGVRTPILNISLPPRLAGWRAASTIPRVVCVSPPTCPCRAAPGRSPFPSRPAWPCSHATSSKLMITWCCRCNPHPACSTKDPECRRQHEQRAALVRAAVAPPNFLEC